MTCRKERKGVEGQIMSFALRWKLKQQPAFNVMEIDLFDPLQVKGIGGHARRTFKAWGLMVYFLATESLLIALTQHTNIYGSPDIVVSDQGSQMVAAANESIN